MAAVKQYHAHWISEDVAPVGAWRGGDFLVFFCALWAVVVPLVVDSDDLGLWRLLTLL